MEAVQILEGQPRLEQSDEARGVVILADARPRRLHRRNEQANAPAWKQARSWPGP